MLGFFVRFTHRSRRDQLLLAQTCKNEIKLRRSDLFHYFLLFMPLKRKPSREHGITRMKKLKYSNNGDFLFE
jgi:hypothetical protein